MRMPDFHISHRELPGSSETVVRFQFCPPVEVRGRMQEHGFRYSRRDQAWIKPEILVEHKVRAIIEHWPD